MAGAAHDSTWTVVARGFGLAALLVGTVFVLAFAAAAAVVVGLMIMGAALAMRLAPKPAPARGTTLEARRTPAGWVVENSARLRR